MPPRALAMMMLLQNAKQGLLNLKLAWASPFVSGDQPPPAARAAGFKLRGSDFPSSSRPADEKGRELECAALCHRRRRRDGGRGVVGVGASWSIQQTPSRVANGKWEVGASRCSIVGGHAHCGLVPLAPSERRGPLYWPIRDLRSLRHGERKCLSKLTLPRNPN